MRRPNFRPDMVKPVGPRGLVRVAHVTVQYRTVARHMEPHVGMRPVTSAIMHGMQ